MSILAMRRLLSAVLPVLMVGGMYLAATMPAQAATQAEAASFAPAAPTFTIFATREGLVGRRTANGHRIQPRDRFVALPSWSVLSSLGGNEFQVRVTYRDQSVVLPVWDVGPWNTRDDYWSPKRRYSDLPVGMPMAQAAYQKGYNDGRDEFGRRIRMPNGIDIADGAFWDDLGMREADWVEVTFLWLGDDMVPEEAPKQPSTPAASAEAPSDTTPPESQVTEVIMQTNGNVLVRWDGTDDLSGIASYDLQVRHFPTGGWVDWIQGTTVTEAVFTPPGAGTFAFRARATDRQGNLQDWREFYDAAITVPPAPPG